MRLLHLLTGMSIQIMCIRMGKGKEVEEEEEEEEETRPNSTLVIWPLQVIRVGRNDSLTIKKWGRGI